jgi:preprotein translocase subunit SecG
MSGAITGSADTFFGQSKANTWDRMLSKLTIGVSVVFAIVVILMYALV